MPDESPDPSEAPDVLADDDGDPDDLPPESVVEEAERLTKLAREAIVDEEADAYRTDRDERLAANDYTARVREDETRDVLVLHPEEWTEDGEIRTDRIEDVDRGIEVPLSGPGEGDDWEAIEEYNREVVADVREEHGDDHAANVSALADFMGNHYAKPIHDATADELEEFLDEYYRRNAWPTPEQREVVEKSVVAAFEVADERCPLE
ncbi:rnhA operon protein [Halosimplex aquaticum]|uniref:RnhA operon protein n=1 Tax=Halosimplex aquaticum TaxID=3026162 RepID=A0ABD5XWN4_9EURY|nr:rnhA operon protein [Halosimplex aquaticum]